LLFCRRRSPFSIIM